MWAFFMELKYSEGVCSTFAVNQTSGVPENYTYTSALLDCGHLYKKINRTQKLQGIPPSP